MQGTEALLLACWFALIAIAVWEWASTLQVQSKRQKEWRMSQALTGAHRAILVEWIRDDIEQGKLNRYNYIVTDAEWAELLKEAEEQ